MRWLGAWRTLASVSVFAVASQVSTLGVMPCLVWHGFSTHHRRDAWRWGVGTSEGHYQTVTQWFLTMNLPVSLIILLLPEPLSPAFGKGFAGGAPAPGILSCPSLARTGEGVSGIVIDMTGHTRPRVANTCAVLVLAIALGQQLIPQ
ncbi:hypothetical protein ACFLT5_00245 [Chloroflexota bacterium]